MQQDRVFPILRNCNDILGSGRHTKRNRTEVQGVTPTGSPSRVRFHCIAYPDIEKDKRSHSARPHRQGRRGPSGELEGLCSCMSGLYRRSLWAELQHRRALFELADSMGLDHLLAEWPSE